MKTIGWRGALGFLLSALLLWWTLKDVRYGEVWAEISRANLPLLLLAVSVGFATYFIRAYKWRFILDPVNPRTPYGPLWRGVAIGMMITNTVPARAGELARAFALASEVPAVPFSAGFASIAVDRLFDALVLFLLLFVAVLTPGFPPGVRLGGRPVETLALLGMLGVIGAGLAVSVAVFFPRSLIMLFELFARRVAPRFEERGRAMLVAFFDGLSVLRSPSRFAIVFALTVVHWLVGALGMWIGFRAVGIDVPLTAGAFVQTVIAVGVALPSSPGFFGVFEAAAKVALVDVYHADPTRTITWALGYHLLGFVPITVIGAYYFSRLGLRLRDVGSVEPGGAAA